METPGIPEVLFLQPQSFSCLQDMFCRMFNGFCTIHTTSDTSKLRMSVFTGLFVMLEMEFKSTHVSVKCSDTELHSSSALQDQFLLFVFVFQDRDSLCSPCCSGTFSIDQAGIILRDSACLCLRSVEIKGVHHRSRSIPD